MSEPLPGLEQPPALTDRQALALTLIRKLGPISSTELAARVRLARNPNGSKSSLEFDASNGKRLGESLAAKGLVRLRVVDGRRLWCAAEWEPERGESAQGTEIPF